MAEVRPRIALLTCRPLPEPDPDESLTVQALERAGFVATMIPWHLPDASCAGCDLSVLRSTWDYYRDPPAFLARLAQFATESSLLNPLATVRWNLHKRYLAELAAAGVPTVPTVWFARGSAAGLSTSEARHWDDLVIKPSVSAGSFETRRFRAGERAAAEGFLTRCLAHRDMMAQPYVAAVEQGGERALVWIDGQLTHVVTKQPRFAAEDEAVSPARAPRADEEAFAARALGALPGPVRQGLLYARIDVFREADGRLLLSELELIEPSLFFKQAPAALAGFVAALARRLP